MKRYLLLFVLLILNCCGRDYGLGLTSSDCPSGYIKVPQNSSYGIYRDFCVMQFEARAWQDTNSDNDVSTGELDDDGCGEAGCTTANWANLSVYKPVSISTVMPWRRISASQALLACRTLGDNYDLPSNNEWMTIARNIEYVNSNWSGGAHGNGCLYSGNSGQTTVCAFHTGAAWDQPAYGAVSSLDPKASMRLSNGEIIWDFVGNMAEAVDWVAGGSYSIVAPNLKPYLASDGGPVAGFRELFDVDSNIDNNGITPPESFLPGGTSLNSTHNIGQYYGGDAVSGGAAYRGGRYNSAGIGLYQFSLSPDPDTTTNHFNGFRCVYRLNN